MSGKLTDEEKELFKESIRIAGDFDAFVPGIGHKVLIEELYQLFKKRHLVEEREDDLGDEGSA